MKNKRIIYNPKNGISYTLKEAANIVNFSEGYLLRMLQNKVRNSTIFRLFNF